MLTSFGGNLDRGHSQHGPSVLTIAIGHHMRPAAKSSEDPTGVPTRFLVD
jgi:hypothetical protein